MILGPLFLMMAAVPQSATPLATVPAPAVRPVDPLVRAKAVKLAQVLNSEGFVVDRGDDEYVKLTTQVLFARGKVNDLEKRYPGVVENMVRAALPTMKNQLRRRMPVLWERLSDSYVAIFTPVELDQAYTFYDSPAGRRIIAMFNNRLQANAIAKDMTKNPDFSVSVGALRSDMQATVPGIVQDMTPADKTALMRFMTTSAFNKIRLNGAKVQQVMLDWMQEVSPEDEKEIEDVMRTAVEAYIASRKNAT